MEVQRSPSALIGALMTAVISWNGERVEAGSEVAWSRTGAHFLRCARSHSALISVLALAAASSGSHPARR